eukprot:gnl/Hemi2/24337_TR8181_c0_g1_i1.p1 gnl/Hemi2/24337_TR8181_c0_g1~~gnl/Hemi2/24337_TR8181_c0_g1_i1.p1  ORF type:complete len:271 (-),score=72.77 gnl/Hemi2/24337_TR8181_c0_g1_i1:580-1392(-)
MGKRGRRQLHTSNNNNDSADFDDSTTTTTTTSALGLDPGGGDSFPPPPTKKQKPANHSELLSPPSFGSSGSVHPSSSFPASTPPASASSTSLEDDSNINTNPNNTDNGTQSSSKPTAPLCIVFQCQHCRTIVGDSFSLIAMDRELQAIILTDVLNIEVKQEAITSRHGRDAGSTFFAMCCTHCNNTLGKVYKTTARHMDGVRDLFSLHQDSISSYELGRPQLSCAENVRDSVPDFGEMRKRVWKLVQLSIAFDMRLQAVESATQLPEPHG